jgi:acetyl esterase/lipase
MRPRYPPPENAEKKLPVILWLCGGGFTAVDSDVWLPELVYFAKQGYAVVSAEYSTSYQTRFPEQVEDVKLAIRFIKAHSKEYGVDPERIALMGESAGGYIASFCALTGKDPKYNTNEYAEFTSEVKNAVIWYSRSRFSHESDIPKNVTYPPDIHNYTDLTQLVNDDSPPFLILHGNNDNLIPIAHSERFYGSLEGKGTSPEMIIVDGAGHGDSNFIQREIKEIILDFLRRKL